MPFSQRPLLSIHLCPAPIRAICWVGTRCIRPFSKIWPQATTSRRRQRHPSTKRDTSLVPTRRTVVGNPAKMVPILPRSFHLWRWLGGTSFGPAGKVAGLVLDAAPVSGALPALVEIAGEPKRVMTISDFAAAKTIGVRSNLEEPGIRIRYDVLKEFADLADRASFPFRLPGRSLLTSGRRRSPSATPAGTGKTHPSAQTLSRLSDLQPGR